MTRPNLDQAAAYICWLRELQEGEYLALRAFDREMKQSSVKFIGSRGSKFANEAQGWLSKWADSDHHIFYSVNGFSRKQAKAEFVASSRIAQVDADNVKLPAAGPRPTRIIQTSPTNFQFLYVLDQPVSGAEIDAISQSLTALVGGDKGGHSRAKLLRLPGTLNVKHKYEPKPIVKLVIGDGPTHSARDLLQLIGNPPEQRSPIADDVVSASTFVDTNSVLKRCWHKLDPYIQAKIRQRKPYNDGWGIRFAGRFYPGEPDDRSAAVFQIGQSLKQAGATPREVLAVIKQTCFWLSREEEGKREDPNRLLNKIFAVESAKPGINAADPADWEGIAVPRQEWIVQRLVPARKVTALYGDGGTGKTLLALQMAVSAALGKEFLGISVEPGRVFALLAENEDDDSHVALDAICWHFGATLGDLRGMMRVASRAGLDSILMAFPLGRGHPSELFQQLLTDIKIFGPKLVILDTAADLFGGNENDRGQVRRFLSEICTRVAVETGAAVLLCAHPSVAGLRSSEGSGGSTAWNNSVRSRLFLRRDIRDGDQEDDPDVRILELKKANLVQRGLAICLRWKDGVFVEDNTHLRIGSEAEIKRMRDIVDVVASRYESGRPFSAHVQSQTGWLGMWLIENMKVSRSNAKRIILGLLDKGLIVELDEPHRHRKGKDRRFL